MVASAWRRFSAGAFALWFAAFGVTRGMGGVCPQHADGHNARSSIGAAAAFASPRATELTRAPTAHAEHGQHASSGSPNRLEASHDVHAHSAEAAPSENAALADTSATDVDATPTQHGDGGCDCRGECCCCTVVRVASATSDIRASIISFASPRSHSAAPDVRRRTTAHLLPFATAPPHTHKV